MPDKIVGKVARINSDRELIINRGAAHGVEMGMRFKVLAANPLEITDPDSDEVIGQVNPVKVVVEVVDVDEKLAIARTFRTRAVNVGGYASGFGATLDRFARAALPPKFEHKTETLRRDPEEGEPLPRAESVVSVGDVVEEASAEDIDAATATLYK